MKKIFLLLTVLAISVSCMNKYEDTLQELGERVDKLEPKIPTIEQQITAIQESISLLEEADRALKAKDEELSNADRNLERLISELKQYVNNEINSTKSWAEASLFTLQKYNSAVSTLAKLEQSIASNKDATSKEINDTISALRTSFQNWVGEQLSGYYSIAKADAEFAALRQSAENGDEKLYGEINNLQTEIAKSATDLTEAYQKAIEEAINDHNGVITAALNEELEEVNKRLDEELATINAKLVELEAQIGKNTEDIVALLARIQSISYIHKYADGKATMIYNGNIYTTILSFEVSPKEAVVVLAKEWKNVVSAKAICQGADEASFVALPIQSLTADEENGIISVSISCTSLPENVIDSQQEAKIAISISNDIDNITSDYIPIVVKNVSNNAICYTSIDGNIVEPQASAFNAGIVSNTYEEGLGVIEFKAPIISIGEGAFEDCSSLISVTIPDSVTSIGYEAFYGCSSLKSVTIPDSVTSIGYEAFYGCSSLTSVTIPDSVTSIGSDAFRYCTLLTSVTIPDSVTKIGGSAFSGCSGLTSVTIPDSVTYIGWSAFYGCSSLTSVTIGNSVTEIGLYTFAYCSSLTSVTIGNSVTEIGSYAFEDCSSLTSITIPDSVTEIGNNAFYNCTSVTNTYVNVTDLAAYATNNNIHSFLGDNKHLLVDGKEITELVIPDSVTEIGEKAFYNCSSLTSVTIGNSVTSIGELAFYGCTGKLIINSKIVETNYTSSNYPMMNNSGSWLYGSKFTKLTVGDNITKIGDYIFRGCSNLTSVTIHDSVTSIGDWAFSGCSSLKDTYVNVTDLAAYTTNNPMYNIDGNKHLLVNGTEITELVIPNSVTKIGESAFENCSSLTSVTIPDSVTEIGERAFSNCSSLTSVTIGNSVTEIGEQAFYNCSHLTSVTIPDSVTSIGLYTFYGCNSLTSVTIGNSVTSIGELAFYGCTGKLIINSKIVETNYTSSNYPMNNSGGWLYGSKFTKLTVGDNITKIGDYIFRGCSSLTSVTIPDSVTSIGLYAFSGCSSLTSVTIPDSVTNIGNNTFAASGIKELILPRRLTSVSSEMCYNCRSLTSITIPDSVTSIGNSAFSRCSSLTSVTIPDSVTSIGDWAFYDCSSLKDTYVNVTDLAAYTTNNPMYKIDGNKHLLVNGTEITELVIPNSVTWIGESAFENCSSLTSVTIPDSVTWIEEDAFQYCTSLTAFYGKFASADNRCLIIDGVLNSFASAGLTEYTIPDSVTSIKNRAFSGCTSLTSVTIGNSVTSIGYGAFFNCTSLTSVYCKPTTPPTGGDDMFSYYHDNRFKPIGCKIYVPRNSVSAYRSRQYWSDYISYIYGYDF